MSGYSTKFSALNAPLVIDTSVGHLALAQLTALRVAKKDQIKAMTIDQRCKSQQITADRIFMDFIYTKPGSTEQLRALKTLHTLVCQWVMFFHGDESYDKEKVSLKETVFSNTY